MEGFTPIETQEQFDKAVQDRLARESKKYEGFEEYKEKAEKYDTLKIERDGFEETANKLQKQIDGDDKNPGYKKQVENLTGQVKDYQTRELKARIARENGIPAELAERLTGKDENELKKDAESLAKIIRSGRKEQPLHTNDPDKIDTKKTAIRGMLDNMKGE